MTAVCTVFGAQAQARRLARVRARFPFVYVRELTRTQGGRPIHALQLGQGQTKLLIAGGHHANECITSALCWALLERYCAALEDGGEFGGVPASRLYYAAVLYLVPMLDPDGAALTAGEIAPGSAEHAAARAIAARYPDVPFPLGWKANLAGVDLNLNYPAGWQAAKTIKAGLGTTSPAPRDWGGGHPLDQPETAALAAYTCCVHPDLVLAYHTQGGEIYHGWRGFEPPGSAQLAAAFAAASGYRVCAVPPQSDNAGFKDWFVSRFRRPGFTIEAGRGENPLPMDQLPALVRENEPIWALAMLA